MNSHFDQELTMTCGTSTERENWNEGIGYLNAVQLLSSACLGVEFVLTNIFPTCLAVV